MPVHLVEGLGSGQISPLRLVGPDRVLLCDCRPLDPIEVVLQRLHGVLDPEHAKPGHQDENQPKHRAELNHDRLRLGAAKSAGQAGAAVRSAARSRAARERGLRSISAASGLTTRRPSCLKLGAAAASGAGAWREPRGARELRRCRNCLTRRSSSE